MKFASLREKLRRKYRYEIAVETTMRRTIRGERQVVKIGSRMFWLVRIEIPIRGGSENNDGKDD